MTYLLLALAVLIAPVRAPVITRLQPRQHAPPKNAPPRDDGPFHRAASWDLLAACLRAGLPVPTAIRAIDVPELRKVADQLALGADAQQAWSVDDPDIAPLARAARRSARSGAALAVQAAELAKKVRAETTDEAEARAQRAAVLVAGPLALCFLPAFVCVGVLPVVLGLATKFIEN